MKTKVLDGKKLAIFELKLRKDTSIYKNKVELRNLTTKFIDQATNHGVFVVYDNQSDDYRLTFATKYTEIDDQGNATFIMSDYSNTSNSENGGDMDTLKNKNFPNISLPNQDGNLLNLHRLDTFRMVLYFYPLNKSSITKVING